MEATINCNKRTLHFLARSIRPEVGAEHVRDLENAEKNRMERLADQLLSASLREGVDRVVLELT